MQKVEALKRSERKKSTNVRVSISLDEIISSKTFESKVSIAHRKRDLSNCLTHLVFGAIAEFSC